MPDFIYIAFAIFGGYLLGSIPFGLVITRLAGLPDIRTTGSGNIGATNVLRTGRKDLALLTLLLDSLKAGLAALGFGLLYARVGWPLGASVSFLAGAAAFVGHCYPVWLGFKGGKGIATYAGLLLFATWKVFLIVAPVWLFVFAVTRISSLAALCAAIIAPPAAYFLGLPTIGVATLSCLSAFVFFTHRANISRLLKGTEPKFGTKS